jgi:hypothetical protein
MALIECRPIHARRVCTIEHRETAAAGHRRSMATTDHRPVELSGWVKVSVFAATLLALTWLGMWLDAPHIW